MKKQFFYGLLLVSLSITFSVSASQSGENYTEDQNPEKIVLIATEESQFKKAVVSKVTEALEKHSCSVKVTDLEKLSDESIQNYQAIVIINTCRVSQLNKHVRKFLKKVNEDEKKKIILLTTAKREAWKPKEAEVDAITSASKMNKVDSIAETIIKKICILLELQ